jgi:hypothetical protein
MGRAKHGNNLITRVNKLTVSTSNLREKKSVRNLTLMAYTHKKRVLCSALYKTRASNKT